jgi:hypothetical protein
MKDMRDVELAVGDTIVYAFVSGNMPYLRIGKIIEFINKKRPYGDSWVEKAKVEWNDTQYEYINGQRVESPKIWTSQIEFGSRALKL